MMNKKASHEANDTPPESNKVRVEEQKAALLSLIDFYAHSARTANLVLFPHHVPPNFGPIAKGAMPKKFVDRTQAASWLEAERDNIMTAQRITIDHKWHDKNWQLAWGLDAFNRRRGNFRDACTMWQAGLSAALALNNPRMQMLALRGLGLAYVQLGDYDTAVEYLRKAAVLAEQMDNIPEQASIHRALAQAWSGCGDYSRARTHAMQALDLAQSAGDKLAEARALNNAGWFSARLDEFDTALRLCKAALQLAKEHNQRECEGFTLDSLGYIAHHTNSYQQALTYYSEAIDIFTDLSIVFNKTNSLERLGHTFVALGRRHEAREAWQAVLEQHQSDHRPIEVRRLRSLMATLV